MHFPYSFPGGNANQNRWNVQPVNYDFFDSFKDEMGSNPIVNEWSSQRSYNSVVPSNISPLYNPLFEFDCSRLPQTFVKNVILGNYQRDRNLAQSVSCVSLAKTMQLLYGKIGAIYDKEINLGTSILIANNLVITARHVIEGKDVRDLSIQFDFIDYDANPLYIPCRAIVEDDPLCDYAIILLMDPLEEKPASITCEAPLSELALLHHPEGRPLKVSVHACDQLTYDSGYLTLFHDSQHVSSGGGYFDPSGRLVAIHLGAQFERDTYNPSKYAITIKAIVQKYPNGILAQLLEEKNPRIGSVIYALTPYNRPFIIEEEGYESKKIFNAACKNFKGISRNKSGVAFSQDNLLKIENKWPQIFNRCLSECLYINGIHGETKKFSVKNYIESDHTIPYSVWNLAKNHKMNRFIKGGGTRPGENSLPAITISYNKHRDLLTTGSSTISNQFRAQLVLKCKKNIDEALIDCFEEYRNKRIKINRSIVNKSLSIHEGLKVITDQDKKHVLKELNL
ncbi:MAG: trypsin-like peptidase domain-containing protein [Nitrosopumilus sp.]|nr:trypsin-like peptidase domain-containing protein [Nitrosopumilus sp.]